MAGACVCVKKVCRAKRQSNAQKEWQEIIQECCLSFYQQIVRFIHVATFPTDRDKNADILLDI